MDLISSSVQPRRRVHAGFQTGEVTFKIRDGEKILGHVPDTIALQGASFDFVLEFLTERTQLRHGAALLGDVKQRSYPAVDLAGGVGLWTVGYAQSPYTDAAKGNFAFKIDSATRQHRFNVWAQRGETFFAERLRNGFADDLLAWVA